MASQGKIALYAAQANLNLLTGAMTYTVAASAPAGAFGVGWINTSLSNELFLWNGSAWCNYQTRYLTLLTADPATSGAGGGQSVNVSDLVEVTTSGFARVAVTIGLGSSGLPCVASNTGLVTFGPVTADMAVAAKYAALVTNASGSAGILCYTWSGFNEQVSASQAMQVAVGNLILSQG